MIRITGIIKKEWIIGTVLISEVLSKEFDRMVGMPITLGRVNHRRFFLSPLIFFRSR
jgi:hypothetical protein